MRFWKKREKEQLFYELYKRYKNVMYRTAFRVVKNETDAQKAVRNAMLGILKKINELPSQEEKLRAYMMVTAHHAAIDIYHTNRKHLRVYSNIAEDILQNRHRCGSNPPNYVVAMGKTEYLLRILKKRNEDYCEVIMLYYYHNFSMRQIGDMFGLTEKAAATKLYRARKALERELGRLGLKAYRGEVVKEG